MPLTTTSDTFDATNGHIENYGSRPLAVIVLGVGYAFDPSYSKLADIESFEATGADRPSLSGVGYVTGALVADDVTVHGVADSPAAVVVFDNGSGDMAGDLVVSVAIDVGPVSGDLPVQWSDGRLVRVDDDELNLAGVTDELAALTARTVAGVAFDDDGDVPAADLSAALGGTGGSFDGTGPALRLGADTYYSAADQAGRVRWQDQGRSGADAALGVQGMGAVDLDRTVAVGPFASTVDASLWPTSELRCEWSGRLVRQRSDPANEYREVLLVTIDGDDDYVEPAFVVEAGGDVTIGLDCLLSSEAGEVAWRSTPLGDPWGYHDYVMTVDDSGLVSVSIDGVAHASGQLAHVDTSVEAAAPIAFLTPPDGHLIIVSTSGMVMDRVALFDAVSGGATVAEFDVAGSSDGATTVGDWGGSGIVIDDRGPVFLGGGIGDGALIAGTDMLPESCTDGWTIALHARLLSPQLRVLASQHGQALLGGGVAGLTVISAPAFSLPLSAVIGDGTSTAMATMAGAEPTGVVWIVATIDPVNDTLALWVDGEQVASADTSALTAYGNPSDPLGLLPFGALADEVAIWRRPLDPDEIAALSGTGP